MFPYRVGGAFSKLAALASRVAAMGTRRVAGIIEPVSFTVEA
jgi:hypothetical protein